LLIDLIRIIRPSVPIECGFAGLALFAGDILKKLVIAGKTAAIFRRASPLTPEEPWIACSRFDAIQLLHHNPVLPVVAHVVDVTDLSYAVGQKRR
jgi:hypothetical protein